MTRNKILLINLNKNVKNKLRTLYVGAIEEITFTSKSATIWYDATTTDAHNIVDFINRNLHINGHFKDDCMTQESKGNNVSSSVISDEQVITFTFYVNDPSRKRSETNKILDRKDNTDKVIIREVPEGNDYVTLGGVNEVNGNIEKSNPDANSSQGQFCTQDENACTSKCNEEGYNEIYQREVKDGGSCNGEAEKGKNHVGGSVDGVTKNSEESIDQKDEKEEDNVNQDGHNDMCESEELYATGSAAYSFEQNNGKEEGDDGNGHKKSKNFSVVELFNNITRKKKKKNKNNFVYKDYEDMKEDKKGFLSEDKILQSEKMPNRNRRSDNVFSDYENYRSRKENIYTCELRIYNMTCDSCGNKIIKFLKNKNLIVSGNSFATENKIKIKINISENVLGASAHVGKGTETEQDSSNNVKRFVNNIMTEIMESGFNNDLIDLYKDDDRNNNCNLFDITLYIFREDVIKAYELLKNVKGVKNVEYDVKNEYIYILYYPDVIGIRYILEMLKKKKNIDAYYDEDKEKYFRSTRNNETNNSRKLIELFCCFIFSIIIIILNNYQMNMGYMNGFYSYGNYKNFRITYNLLKTNNGNENFVNDEFTNYSFYNVSKHNSHSDYPNVYSTYSIQSNDKKKETSIKKTSSLLTENNERKGIFSSSHSTNNAQLNGLHKEKHSYKNKTNGDKSNATYQTLLPKYEADMKRVVGKNAYGGGVNDKNMKVTYFKEDHVKGKDKELSYANGGDKIVKYAHFMEGNSKGEEPKVENVYAVYFKKKRVIGEMSNGKNIEGESVKENNSKEKKPKAENVDAVDFKQKHVKEEESSGQNVEEESVKENNSKEKKPKAENVEAVDFKQKHVKGEESSWQNVEEESVKENNIKEKKPKGENMDVVDLKQACKKGEDTESEKERGRELQLIKRIISNSNFLHKILKNLDNGKGKKLPEIDDIHFLYDFRREEKYLDSSNYARSFNEPVSTSSSSRFCSRFRKDINHQRNLHIFREDQREKEARKRDVLEATKETSPKIVVETEKGVTLEDAAEGKRGNIRGRGCGEGKPTSENDSNGKDEPKERIRKNEFWKMQWLFSFVNNSMPKESVDNSTKSLDTKVLGSAPLRLLLIFILSSVVYIYFGFHFVLNGYKNLKNKIINMNVLIAISSSFSYIYSLFLLVFCLLFGVDMEGIPLYFDSSALLICIMKFGFEVENFLVSFTKKKMEDLYERTTKHVYILEEKNEKKEEEEGKSEKEQLGIAESIHGSCSYGSSSLSLDRRDIHAKKMFSKDKKIKLNDFTINSYPVQFIQKYDTLVFYEGATLLIDGIKVNDEISYVDESMINGEKKPIKKYKGDKIYAGSKCVEGIVILYIEDISKGNYIEYIKKTLDEVNCKKTNLQLYADRIASVFIPVIIALCIVVFFIWFYLTYFDYVNIKKDNYFKLNRFLSCIFFSIHFSLSILCVACPCAVGLASPLSIAISSYICSNIGIIIKNINIFEIFLECNHFIFDKTGTLTVGKPVVNKVYISNNLDIFIDQLLKDISGNNLSLNWDYHTDGNDLRYASRHGIEYKCHLLKGKSSNQDEQFPLFVTTVSKGKNVYSKIEDNEEDDRYNGYHSDRSNASHGENCSDILVHNDGVFLSNEKLDNGSCGKKDVAMREAEWSRGKRKNGKGSKYLNFVEKINCPGKDVSFYSFTPQNDYYKIEIKKSVKKKKEKSNQRNVVEDEDSCSRNKSIFNCIVSFINDKRKKRKYDKISDSSLKEYFINNSDISFSSFDDSYTSKTSSENIGTDIFDNSALKNTEITHGSFSNGNVCEYKPNDKKDGREDKNTLYGNKNTPFCDQNYIREKIANWLYLFLTLSVNIEKYSNHLYASAINNFVNNNMNINETFEIHNLKNEKNQGITGIINDLSVTIGTLFFCYTKYKNTHCSKGEIKEEKLNIKNFVTHLYACDCNVHKTYQFLYNYSHSKKNESNNIIFMCIEGIVVGFFTLVDDIKPEVFDLIKYLKKEKKKVYVCTGDNYMNAIYISKILGIPKKNVSSNTLPMEKVHFVKKIQSLDDGKVCMIGDGINDCFALKSADLGLSLSTRSNVVMDSADACIVDNNISFDHCHFVLSVLKTVRKIKICCHAAPVCFYGTYNPYKALGKLASVVTGKRVCRQTGTPENCVQSNARIPMRMVKSIVWCDRGPSPQLRHIRLHKFGGRSIKWENTTTFR
ncbi:copper-transporting ATPase, putative (CuTP) [Plasmodium ovale curtisi]|uniref:Copper-transporting ATPase, putative (CuTP) n=1 Tax=Plasmodium ovale curtisi TaxID=864141 RepID=A0A1A8VR64_PLAOA|nr:copper-transporting ATPase, putative (CuTP) [Plasmodium ovale curtisi]